MPRSIAWSRILAEGTIIVVSILLAFAIDASWQRAQDRREERLALRALQEEFRGNEELFVEMLERIREQTAIVEELAGIVAAAEDEAEIQVRGATLRALVSFMTVEPAVGTLNTLLGSGRIDLVSDPALQRALAGWPARLADAAEDEMLLRDFVIRDLIPALAGLVDLSSVNGTFSPLGSTSPDDEVLERAYPVRVTPTTRQFLGLRVRLGRGATWEAERRVAGTRELVALLETAR